MAQTGIFNVLDYGVSTDNSPGDNTTALQNLVTNLLSAEGHTNGNGGTIQFPMVRGATGEGTYQFNNTITVGLTSPGPAVGPATIIFMGTCPGSYDESASMWIPVLEMVQNPVPLFYVNNRNAMNPDDNIAGIVFQDLHIKYDSSLIAPAGQPVAAIHAAKDAENVRVFRMVFIDCPSAVFFEGSQQNSMLECTVVGGTNIDACVVLGSDPYQAIETYIAGCLFRSKHNGIGVRIHNTEHVRILNTRLEGFQYGIYIQPKGTSFRNYFANISAYQTGNNGTLGGAVAIVPQTGGTVKETVFVGCDFGAADTAGTNYTLGGIYVDASNGIIDTVRFVSCQSIKWPGPGLQIVSGTNIEVIGGQYSSNGQLTSGSGSSPYQYGIAITGPATNVRIIGASCAGSALGLSAQQYGIYVSNGCTHVLVRDCDAVGNVQYAMFIGKGGGTAPDYVYVSDCDFTGYATGHTIQFDHPGSNVKIVNCAGYNNRLIVVTSTLPVGSFSGPGLGYYGPVTFYISGGSIAQIAVDGNNTHLTSGAFTLEPEESAQITYSGSPTFLMIGK